MATKRVEVAEFLYAEFGWRSPYSQRPRKNPVTA